MSKIEIRYTVATGWDGENPKVEKVTAKICPNTAIIQGNNFAFGYRRRIRLERWAKIAKTEDEAVLNYIQQCVDRIESAEHCLVLRKKELVEALAFRNKVKHDSARSKATG